MKSIDYVNILLMIFGAVLIVSGPWIIYSTIRGIKNAPPHTGTGSRVYSVFSDGLNFVIAIMFFVAGILFIVNNLRGNPIPV